MLSFYEFIFSLKVSHSTPVKQQQQQQQSQKQKQNKKKEKIIKNIITQTKANKINNNNNKRNELWQLQTGNEIGSV